MDTPNATNIPPLEKFTFSDHSKWPQWRKRFERYMSVSGACSKTDAEKIDFFLYILGEEADNILLQFPKHPETYEECIQYFENYFIPSRNIIFERFKFNSRIQLKGEPIDSFITALHTLAEYCNYGDLKDELIRDRIVVGMIDTEMSKRLQFMSSLTLSEAVTLVRQADQSQQTKEIQNEETNIDELIKKAAINRRKKDQSKRRTLEQQQFQSPQLQHLPKNQVLQLKNIVYIDNQTHRKMNSSAENSNQKGRREICKFCGKGAHRRDDCPARDSTCRLCSKIGHWDKVCKTVCQYCDESAHPRAQCPAKNSFCRNCGKLGHWDIVCES